MKFSLLLLSSLVFSCNPNTIKNKAILHDFNQKISIKFEPFYSSTNNIVGINLYNDTLAIVRNNTPHHHHFSLFNLTSKKKKQDILKAGRKEDESLGFIAYGIEKSNLWVYDIVKNKLIITEINDNTKFQTTDFPTFYFNIQLIGNDKILASGNHSASYKLYKLNLKDNQLTDSLFAYRKKTSATEKMDYESFLFVNPEGSNAVLATRYADQLEFFDLETRKSKQAYAVENYAPDLGRMKQGTTVISARNNKTKFGFLGGKGKKDFVYLLYSGENHNAKNGFYGNKIFAYKWNGAPIAIIQLDRDIIDFDISTDGKTIYAVDAIKNEILKSTIDFN